MNKNVVNILIFVFFLQYLSYAQPINEKTVGIVAENFHSFLMEKEDVRVNIIKKNYYMNYLVYYTVVFDNNDWVIISNDKRASPILAFSVSKNYSEDIAPGAEIFLLEYKLYVYNISQGNSNTNYMILWDDLINNNIYKYKYTKDMDFVEPLIKTKWGQSISNDGNDTNAYNYYAPSGQYSNMPLNTCSHTLAGCPAVAVGQILKYWEKPNCNIFEWSNMSNILNTNNPNYSLCKEEIANLLRNIGDKIVGYKYYCDYSGGTDINIFNALVNNFYYTNAILVERKNYKNNEWKEILIQELLNNRPVLYMGYNYDYYGHIFICDGYKDVFLGKRFHFNFGWNGVSDGYYSFQNPEGYSYNQKAIINIYPKTCDNELTIFDFYSSSLFISYLYYTPIAGYIYSSPESITIKSNESVHYRAYNEIVLENFETEEGADFVAEIVPCPVTCDFTNYKIYKSLIYPITKNEINNMPLNAHKITVYPNPCNDQFYLQQSDDEICKIQMFDARGQLILDKVFDTKIINIYLSEYPAGIYIIKYSSDKYNYQCKIIKQ